MESSSPEPTVSLDSVTLDLKNQTLGPDDASTAKLKLEDLNWDHSFVRALPGDPRADTIPRQVVLSFLKSFDFYGFLCCLD